MHTILYYCTEILRDMSTNRWNYIGFISTRVLYKKIKKFYYTKIIFNGNCSLSEHRTTLSGVLAYYSIKIVL